MNKRFVLTVYVLVFLSTAMLSVLLELVSSPQAIFRRPITIKERSGNVLTEFQVLLTIDTASLISAGKMRSDCGDVRFEDSKGLDVSYWIESGCNSDETRIWVKVPFIPPSASTTIFMYYGNLSATSESSGEKTFEFFDDFNDNSIDTDKWTGIAGTVVEQNQRLEMGSATEEFSRIYTVATIPAPLIIEYHASHLGVPNSDVYLYYGRSLPKATNRYAIKKGSVYSWGVGNACMAIEEWDETTIVGANAVYWPPTTAKEKYMITVADTTSTTFKNLDKNITVLRSLANPPSGTPIGLYTWFTSAHFDNIIARKYASQEPTIYVGEEGRYMFDVTWGLGIGPYKINAFCNDRLTSFSLDKVQRHLGFIISADDSGFCGITIPRNRLDSPFNVTVNETLISYTISQNETDSSLSFTYTSGTHDIKILGTERGCIIGDLNADGVVNIIDISITARNFGNKDKDFP